MNNKTALLLFLCTSLTAQTPTCIWAQFGNVLRCVAPSSLGVQGPTGPQGPQGIPGPQGPAGPVGSGSGITGGPCVTADGSVALFVRLPDNSCLPVVASGTFIAQKALVDTQGRPVPVGTVAGIAGLELVGAQGVYVGVPGR